MTERVRVTGGLKVFGYEPGQEFPADEIPAEQLERLVARGSLERVTSNDSASRKSESRTDHAQASPEQEE